MVLACVSVIAGACGGADRSSSSNGSTSSGGATGPTLDNKDGGASTQNPGSSGSTSGGSSGTAEGTVTITSETVDVNATPRSFVLASPSTYNANGKYALIVALHGDGESGAIMQQMLRFEDVSGQSAFVAYPTGASETWDLYDPTPQNSDLAFITTLVQSLRTRFPAIDASRVFGIGLSSGAFMVNQVACRQSSLFRGIVPHSGGAPSEPRDPSAGTWGNGFVKCAGQTNGPAVMVMHGTADTMVPLESGEYTANYWATVNGCATTRSPSGPTPCAKQDNCPGTYPVLFCPIANLGHQLWPDAAKTAWGFFSTL